MSQTWPPQIDFSTDADDPILQGIDSAIELTFGPGEALAETDVFRQVFRKDLNDEVPLGVTEGYSIDMETRTVTLVVDGETHRKWFRDDDFTEQTREFPILAQYQHTDAAGDDRDDSGLEILYRFRVTVARGQRDA